MRVATEHAGRKGHCPSCKAVVAVPQPDPISLADPIPIAREPQDEELAARCAVPHNKAERLSDMPEGGSSRRFPWFIDIFLYPFSISGIANLCIFWFVPIFLSLIPLLGLIGILLAIARVIVAAYMYYYLLDCIRDSAVGGVRAPENVGSQPGISDAMDAFKQVIASMVIFWGPLLAWLIYVRWHNYSSPANTINPISSPVFWTALVYAVLFFPVGALAVAMMDFVDAVKPWVWVKAVFSAFVEYVGLVLLFSAVVAVIFATYLLSEAVPLLGLLFRGINICLLMITGHLIGRFYYRNSKKLGWDD